MYHYDNFFPNLSSIISEKMRGYPQDLLFLASHKPPKNIVVLVGKFLKKPEYPEMRRTYA